MIVPTQLTVLNYDDQPTNLLRLKVVIRQFSDVFVKYIMIYLCNRWLCLLCRVLLQVILSQLCFV